MRMFNIDETDRFKGGTLSISIRESCKILVLIFIRMTISISILTVSRMTLLISIFQGRYLPRKFPAAEAESPALGRQSSLQVLSSSIESEFIQTNLRIVVLAIDDFQPTTEIFYQHLFRPVSRNLHKGWMFDWGLLRTMLWQIPNFCEVP